MIVYREAPTLARDLGVSLKTLYAVSNRLSAHYHKVELPKSGGGVRRLTVPDQVLKHIQRAIARTLLAPQSVSPHATAYRCGTGVFRNAAPHAGRAQILKLDIRHFFDSVLYSTVKERVFPPEVYAESLRVLLTVLCYHGDALPQGAPTSPFIANLILQNFDDKVGAWCSRRGVTYTRYCDDLTFSGSGSLKEVHAYVEERLRREGYFLNEKKTLLLRAGQRQSVTGLVVNERPRVPSNYRRRLRQEVYYCKKFGVVGHLAHIGDSTPPERYVNRLLGRTAWVLQADPADREAAEQHAWLRTCLSPPRI